MTDDLSMASAYVDPRTGPLGDQRFKAHRAWRAAETIKRLSDRLIGVGPLGIGLAYGLGAGGLLLFHAVQSKATPSTLGRMTAYLAADNLSDTVPVLGWAVDTLFPGHLMAAKALQKDIEARHGLPEEVALERSQKKRGL